MSVLRFVSHCIGSKCQMGGSIAGRRFCAGMKLLEEFSEAKQNNTVASLCCWMREAGLLCEAGSKLCFEHCEGEMPLWFAQP